MSDNALALADSILTPPLVRENVRAVIKTMEDHHVRQVPIDDRLAMAIPIVAARLVNEASPRMQATGAKLIQAALKYNLELYAVADKAARLDAGEATERIGHSVTRVLLDGEKLPE